jgi:hypothetical protein
MRRIAFHKISWNYLNKNLELAKIQSLMWPLMFMLVGCSLVIAIYFRRIAGHRRDDHYRYADRSSSVTFSPLIWPMIAFGWVTKNILQPGRRWAASCAS